MISRASVTPEDGGCQDYLASLLTPLGFSRQHVDVGSVANSIYTRPGQKPGLLAFAGHTDVVPPGDESTWEVPPFKPTVMHGALHGRGAQDMKSAIACWIAAVEQLVDAAEPLPTLQLLITSDEEGESVDGTVRIVEHLEAEGRLPDAVIVGEPSSSVQVGDTVRCGRRGITVVDIVFRGRQGHSAYAHEAENAIHIAVPALAKVAAIDWGRPEDGFPPTTCQITNLSAGTGATNVIPGSCTAIVDIRYNPANKPADIECRVRDACRGAVADIRFRHQGNAFCTPDGPWLDLVCDSIRCVTGYSPLRDTGGGTSDGRFFAAAGVPVVELGLTNDTIHQVNERVYVHELDTLTRIYVDIIQHFEE